MRPTQRFSYRKMPRSKKSDGIDPNLFVNKAQELQTPVEEPVRGSFADLALHQSLLQIVQERGFTNPTPIQTKAIPHIIAGKDVIGLANTGTGKTGAFLLPLLQQLQQNPGHETLILVPTRELGLQIHDELRAFSQKMPVRSALLIGGVNMHKQLQFLRRKPQFVIGTPGRIKDLIERKMLPLSAIRTVVLDEADRMVDMGFIKDITTILSYVPESRQSLFFSATMPNSVTTIVNRFMRDPVTVSVVQQQTAAHVDQDVVRVSADQNKVQVLTEMLQKAEFDRTIVFGRTKRGVEKLSKMLELRGIPTVSIHGDKPQNKRQLAIRQFKAGEARVLVATDVAARGIDIDNVSHVINFDQPATYEDYIHRIGRTGRGDKKGRAFTFV